MQDAVQQKIVSIIDQLQATAPKAAALALEATRADAAASIFEGLLAAAVLAGAVWVWRKKLWPKFREDEADIPEVIAATVLALTGAIAVICIIATICDPWTYIALAKPELRIAHQILAASGGN